VPPMRPCLGCGSMIPVRERQSRCKECRKGRWGLGLTGERGSRAGWRVLRNRIVARDGYACTECGATENLAVHHIDGNARNDDPTNLTTLCEECHQNV
jgi:5-methylcytosine-specific restriction endonuclease McrA